MRSSKAGAVLRHLETYLGVLDRTSRATDRETGNLLAVQIGRWREVPAAGAVTCVTLGLSDVVLELPAEGHVRQELLIACYQEHLSDQWLDLMFTVAHDLAERRQALLHGVCLDLGAPISEGSTIEGFLPFPPIYFDSGFAELDIPNELPVMFSWLVPLTRPEIRFIEERGWEAFDRHLESADPDLLDYSRVSSVGPAGS